MNNPSEAVRALLARFPAPWRVDESYTDSGWRYAGITSSAPQAFEDVCDQWGLSPDDTRLLAAAMDAFTALAAEVEGLRADLARNGFALDAALGRAKEAEADAERLGYLDQAARALLITVQKDVRLIYEAMPGLPVTAETCEQATNAFITFCGAFNDLIEGPDITAAYDGLEGDE